MSKRVAEFDHFFGMKRARSLQSLARELKETTDINTQDPFVYEGKIVTTPALFALATELALKALYCQETKSDKVKATHDLIKLFEQLGENTQAELEATLRSWGKTREDDLKQSGQSPVKDTTCFVREQNNLRLLAVSF